MAPKKRAKKTFVLPASPATPNSPRPNSQATARLFESEHQRDSEYGQKGTKTGNIFMLMTFHAKFNAEFDKAVKDGVKTLREVPKWNIELKKRMLRVFHEEEIDAVFDIFKKVTGSSQSNLDKTLAAKLKPQTLELNTILKHMVNGEEKAMLVASAAMLWQIKPILEDQGFKFNEELGINVKLFEVGDDTTIDTTIIEAGGWIVETETYDDMSQG